MIFPLKMVIFHSYVSLAEGITKLGPILPVHGTTRLTRPWEMTCKAPTQ